MHIDKIHFSLLMVVKNNSKLLIIVSIFAILTSITFSSPYFISPKFKSKAVIYPSNLIKYSQESPTEQLLQLFQSNDIRDSIIKKFDLMNRYQIDSTKISPFYSLHKEYEKNVVVEKTKFESVLIEAADEDPLIAKDIVLELIDQLNIKVNLLHQEKSKEAVVIFKSQINSKTKLIDTLETQIRKHSTQYGLLDYTQQSRELTAGYMNLLLQNKKGENLRKVEDLYENLKKEGAFFNDLSHQLNLARQEYNRLLIGYDNAVKDVNKKLTYTSVVVRPEIPDRKSYPIRWLIVSLSFFSSIFLTFITLLIFNRIKSYN